MGQIICISKNPRLLGQGLIFTEQILNQSTKKDHMMSIIGLTVSLFFGRIGLMVEVLFFILYRPCYSWAPVSKFS